MHRARLVFLAVLASLPVVACAHRDEPRDAPPAPAASVALPEGLATPSARLRPVVTPSQMKVFRDALDRAQDGGARD